jgi:preprotein translocase subunit SecA
MLAPTQDYRRTDHRIPARPLTGADVLVNSVIGRTRRRGAVTAKLQQQAFAADALAPQFIELSDHELQTRLLDFRGAFRAQCKLEPQVTLSALAAIREAADRRLGMRPFPVQLMGALALHRGFLAEMATGEGKTLTAGIAAVLAGWSRRPCHVLTVNDYLVERDAAWLRPLYEFCGVRVGTVTGAAAQPERINGYAADITYATSKELLADFLRDRLRLGKLTHPTRRLLQRMLAPQSVQTDGLVLRGLHTAIVDEADSILIDEAVTPLIIAASHKNESLRRAAELADALAGSLRPGAHYSANARYREVDLTSAGLEELVRGAETLPGLWRGHDRRLELVVQALVAREFFHRDKQYILQEGKVVIVDEFTGRPMPQRTWREGMHQAIEAKEKVAISDPSETVARLSFQRFFRCFHKLSGMSGTAREAAPELWQVYGLPVITIPRNKPCIRKQLGDQVFASEAEKWDAVVDSMEATHRTGRPVLAGTRSVSASEELAARLQARGVESKVLNATRLSDEAAIVAMAGERGRITIATNMAGRGTDIKLGQGVRELGGLHVIATERHESGRVDRQLFGRAGRQGDPGSAQAFWSAEDELLRRHLPKARRDLLMRILPKAAARSDEVAPLALRAPTGRSATGTNSEIASEPRFWESRRLAGPVSLLAQLAIRSAQRRAESAAYKQRQAVLKSDLWLDQALSFAGA